MVSLSFFFYDSYFLHLFLYIYIYTVYLIFIHLFIITIMIIIIIIYSCYDFLYTMSEIPRFGFDSIVGLDFMCDADSSII